MICPFGIIARLYDRFSFLKIKKNGNICFGCKQEERILTSLSKNSGSTNCYKIHEKEDWYFKLECLKQCGTNSVHFEYVNPLKDNSPFEGLKIVEVLAPAIIIALFSAHVFLKSNYIANLFFKIQSYFTIDLNIFIFIAIMLVVILIVLIYLFIIYIS
ncbi:MAG: hypothetical protein V3T59_08990, partial [Desulfobacterales bacterium]